MEGNGKTLLTEVLVSLILVHVLSEFDDFLLAMEDTGMMNRSGKGI